jgi:hypothetical protein
MTETERSDEATMNTDAPSDAPAPESAAATPDAAQFLAQLSAQTLPEAEAALKALVAGKPGEALPLLEMAAQQGSLALASKAMDALAALRTQDAADALANLGADRSDAPRAKEARRALHKLNLAGIKAVALVPPVFENGPDRVWACMASPVDGSGTRTVTVVRENRFDTLNMAVFFVNEKNGVIDAQGAIPCSMSVWKHYLADAAASEMKLIPVELAFCQTQLELAAARNERSKTPLPERYYYLSQLVSGPSELRERPAQLDPEAIKANPDLIAKSSALFQLPEFRTWLFTFEEVRPYVLKVIAEARRQQNSERKSDMPVLDLNEVQREGAMVAATMNGLFDGARRSTFQERLEYTADLLWRSDRLEEAQWAMAAALALAPESTLPIEQHPFLREVALQSLTLGVQVEQSGVPPEAIARGTAGASAAKKDEPEEYVDAEGLIRRKSGLIIPR